MGERRGSQKSRPDEIRIIIAGGGTGGHLFPGLAVGREIAGRFSRPKVLFITGRGDMESDIISRSGFMRESINVEGLKGRGLRRAAAASAKIPMAVFRSAGIIKRFSPHVVFGVGGYSSGPVCLAAKLIRIPIAVHEQNSFPGLTNRLLCRIADRVFISFEESRRYFPAGTIVMTGNPVRKELLERGPETGPGNGTFTVLVIGGSQGAMAVNRAFLASLEIFKRKGIAINVIHQTGRLDWGYVRDQYEKKGFRGKVTPFIEDMGEAYNNAHIIVSRAGASTISEIAALGKPSILVPYPYAANRHQESNARMLAMAGGAEILPQDDLTGERLAEVLIRYMEDRIALKRMGDRAKKMAMPGAVNLIAEEIEKMAFARREAD